jgi:hypothetical protein
VTPSLLLHCVRGHGSRVNSANHLADSPVPYQRPQRKASEKPCHGEWSEPSHRFCAATPWIIAAPCAMRRDAFPHSVQDRLYRQHDIGLRWSIALLNPSGETRQVSADLSGLPPVRVSDCRLPAGDSAPPVEPTAPPIHSRNVCLCDDYANNSQCECRQCAFTRASRGAHFGGAGKAFPNYPTG